MLLIGLGRSPNTRRVAITLKFHDMPFEQRRFPVAGGAVLLPLRSTTLTWRKASPPVWKL